MRRHSLSATGPSPSPSLTHGPVAPRRRSGRPESDSATRVAYIEKNGAEFFDVVCGLAKLGAVGVPVNWRLAPPEMLHIIEDCAGAASSWWAPSSSVTSRRSRIG